MVIDLLIALLIALLLTWFFSVVLGSTGPWSGFWVFFLVVLMFSWAMALWVRPMGPALWGVYWLPYLVFGGLIALLIAAAAPAGERPRRSGPRGRGTDAATSEQIEAASTVVAVGTFVWIALALLLAIIAIGYLV